MASLSNCTSFNQTLSRPIQISRSFFPSKNSTYFKLKKPKAKPIFTIFATNTTQEESIPIPDDDVKTLVKFKSKYNLIEVLEVSRKADHPFAGSRLLLLDKPGNIHSVSFLFKLYTETYFDLFATLPTILPKGPLGILGFGAGSAAKLILELYPERELEVHGWELDSYVISVGRKWFGLYTLEKENPERLYVHIGDALEASVDGGFAGILIDLFSNGSLIPELQDPETWMRLKGRLREGGRIMVNVGGSCVEAENKGRDGDVVMEETLKAMRNVFGGDQVFVQSLGGRSEDSSIALTGGLPDLQEWKQVLPAALRGYVDMWSPYEG